jgi:hypothetical protein
VADPAGRAVSLPCDKIEWQDDVPRLGNGNLMSVIVAATLPDGVVLGSDTSNSIPGPPDDYDGPMPPDVTQRGGLLKVFEGRETILALGQRPIGVAIYGTPTIGSRSIESHLQEFIVSDPHGVIGGASTLQAVAEELRSFFFRLHEKVVVPSVEEFRKRPYNEVPESERPGFGFVLGGYSANSYSGETWHIFVPTNKEPVQLRKPGDHSLNWFGNIDPINRFIKGYSDNMVAELRRYIENSRDRLLSDQEQKDFNRIIDSSEYIMPTTAMPVKVGVEMVRFLVGLSINYYRFAIGPTYAAGGPIIGMASYRNAKFEIL